MINDITNQATPKSDLLVHSLLMTSTLSFQSKEKVLDLWLLEMRGSKSYFQCFIGDCS